MIKKSFYIKIKDGIEFSKISGDNNKIHLDDREGYNSIFGEKICHGCLVILRLFKIINLKKYFNRTKNISIKFNKHLSYEKKIVIKLRKASKVIYIDLLQFNEIRCSIEISFKKIIKKYSFNKVRKKINPSKKIKNYYLKENNLATLSMLLCVLSKYVGKTYPGNNSIINEIDICIDDFVRARDNKIKIYSKKIDKRFPFILNLIKFNNYNINFKTSERPTLKIANTKPNFQTKKNVNRINENVLIIGGSSGLGLDILNIIKKNKKIKVFATYNKNKIKVKDKNVYRIKSDLSKNFDAIKKIFKINKSLIIYYFASPKININSNNNYEKKLYNNFFINYPLKIISLSKKNKVKFFYPSTIFINQGDNSNYTKIKKLGEKILIKKSNKNLKINICRINEVNTKQNLSLFSKTLPSFVYLINHNKIFQKKVFFNDN